jgi:tRNA pseudouridine55 synthase
MINQDEARLILIDKEPGWTSFDVVSKIRSTISPKKSKKRKSRIKVGHAGTLDPFATGLLIILIGQVTKNQEGFMKLNKEYYATLKLGHVSNTGDPEGEIRQIPENEYKRPTKEQILGAVKKFHGKIMQAPPAFSAIKIQGERAYTLARAGKEVNIKPRMVTVYTLKVIDYKWPLLKIKTEVSSGTYIRTLAEDLGKELNCGAYLTSLKRTKIGDYDIAKAEKVGEALKNLAHGQKLS